MIKQIVTSLALVSMSLMSMELQNVGKITSWKKNELYQPLVPYDGVNISGHTETTYQPQLMHETQQRLSCTRMKESYHHCYTRTADWYDRQHPCIQYCCFVSGLSACILTVGIACNACSMKLLAVYVQHHFMP